MKRRDFLFLLGALPFAREAFAYSSANYSKIVYPGKSGKMIYVPDENGNTIPDFSNCGYMGGGVKLPDAPVKVTLTPLAGSRDDTARIQNAIDVVSKMSVDARGMREIGRASCRERV